MNSDKLITAKAHDWARAAMKNNSCSFYDFFDPARTEKIADIIKEYKEIECSFYGGYDYAERKMLSVYPKEYEPGEDEYAISILKFKKSADISHRDVLGSLMGIGISREKTGDIIFGDSDVSIILKENIADYVLMNLTRIGSGEVSLEKIDAYKIEAKEPEGKEIDVIVASMRADGIISAAFKISRSLSLQYIKAERVKINHELLTKQAKELKEGDMVSVRGKGRMEIIKESGKTKKGNIKLTVKRYV
ncbi:MAG: YlmH/Sll1252 family protein [Eubacteriaceae bacterium]